MKKIFLLTAITFFVSTLAWSQCVPDVSLTDPGLSPADSLFPCILKGEAFDTSIQFKNFSSVDGHDFVNAIPAGTTATVDSIKILALYNVPAGLTAAFNSPDSIYTSGENGCISVMGTATADTGVYPIKFKAHVWLSANIPLLGLQHYDTDVDSNQLNQIGLSYDINVIDSTGICPTCFPYTELTVTSSGNQATATSTSRHNPSSVTYWVAGIDTNTTGEFTFDTSGTYTIYSEAVTASCGKDIDSADVTISIASSVQDFNNTGAAISVFPNPGNGKMQLKINSASTSESYTVRVYNVQGREVYTSNFSGNVNAIIDLQTAGAGVYFMHINSRNVSSVQKLMVK